MSPVSGQILKSAGVGVFVSFVPEEQASYVPSYILEFRCTTFRCLFRQQPSELVCTLLHLFSKSSCSTPAFLCECKKMRIAWADEVGKMASSF